MSHPAHSLPVEEQHHIDAAKARIGVREFIALIAALMAVNALAIDIMLPAMEEIKASFGVVGENLHHYIIFAYLISMGASQLFVGPLSDRFGRRLPLLIGLFLYSVASLACVFAPSFFTLLVLRVIQGIGGAVARALCVSVVRDLYGGRQMAEVMSIVMMVFMVVPIFAPAMGQTIMFFGPWQGIFIVMAAGCMLLTGWVWRRLPETLYIKRPLTFSGVFQSFSLVLSNRVACCYTLAFSILLSALFGSLYTTQQVYDGIYHLGVWFPVAFAGVALFQASASFCNAYFVGRFGMRRISHGSLSVFIFVSAIWMLWTLWSDESISFVGYMILFSTNMFAFGTMGANFNALAMEPLGKVAGTASAIFGFLQTVIGAGGGFLVAQAFHGTTTPLVISFFIVGVLALMLVVVAEKGRLFQPHNAPPPR